MENVKIAELCHEVNRAYCVSLGDNSQLAWADAPDWQKNSAVDGVEYHLTVEGTKPEDSHVNWLKMKNEEGWTYGRVKDPIKKTHPCMVAFNLLPAPQKAKDHIFKAICDFFKDHAEILDPQ